MTRHVLCGPTPCGPAPKRPGSWLLAAADGRQDHLSRPAARWGRGFPVPAPITPDPTPLPTPLPTPVPTPAHGTLRAIRVLRSPR